MSNNHQIVTKPENTSILNIPKASSLTQANDDQHKLIHSQIIQQQAQLIENAFKEIQEGQCEIVVELDKPLATELFKELIKQGYSVYQSMSYNSRNSNHQKKYKLVISVYPTENYEIINQFEKDVVDIMSVFTQPRIFYPSLFQTRYLPGRYW